MRTHSREGRAFLREYPSINAFLKAKKEGKKVDSFLKEEEEQKLLGEKPWNSELYLESLEWQIRFLLEKIELLEEKGRKLEKKTKDCLKEDQEAQLLQSIPGVGIVSAATLLSEIKDIRRFASVGKLAGYCGLASCP